MALPAGRDLDLDTTACDHRAGRLLVCDSGRGRVCRARHLASLIGRPRRRAPGGGRARRPGAGGRGRRGRGARSAPRSFARSPRTSPRRRPGSCGRCRGSGPGAPPAPTRGPARCSSSSLDVSEGVGVLLLGERVHRAQRLAAPRQALELSLDLVALLLAQRLARGLDLATEPGGDPLQLRRRLVAPIAQVRRRGPRPRSPTRPSRAAWPEAPPPPASRRGAAPSRRRRRAGRACGARARRRARRPRRAPRPSPRAARRAAPGARSPPGRGSRASPAGAGPAAPRPAARRARRARMPRGPAPPRSPARSPLSAARARSRACARRLERRGDPPQPGAHGIVARAFAACRGLVGQRAERGAAPLELPGELGRGARTAPRRGR